MRILLLAALCLASPGLGAAAEKAPEPAQAAAEPAPATNQDCLACHEAAKPGEPGVRPGELAKSVHKDLDCVTCHAGYAAPGPHEVPAPTDPADAALLQRLAAGKTADGAPRTTAPSAYLACGGCHSDSVDTFRSSTHASWLREDRKVAGPSCATCHGTPHEIALIPRRGTPEFRPYWQALSATCESCHADPKFVEAAGLPEAAAPTYHDSIHGRLVAIGSDRAPLCADCHAWSVRPKGGADDPRPFVLPGGHDTLSSHELAISTVRFSDPPKDSDNRVRTCSQCHQGATASFAGIISHHPLEETGRVPHLVHVLFSWLTTLTLLFFAFHVAVDFVFELRRRFERHAPLDPALATRTVKRFDLHQRVQHWLMLSGVILLAVTGWPLRGAGVAAPDLAARVEASRRFLALFGGAHGAGVAHRVGAVLIMLSGVYHLVYLATLARKKILPLSMVPVPRDALDIRDNLLFMLGLRKERPRFDRYNYLEKFDYWAVFWGIIMMVGSGFVFWFPVAFSHVVPTWVLTSAQIIHGEEATLAATFLFVVHFYNVHLKPSIFPMNWAWLTGETTLEYMKDEHPAEYERLLSGKDE